MMLYRFAHTTGLLVSDTYPLSSHHGSLGPADAILLLLTYDARHCSSPRCRTAERYNRSAPKDALLLISRTQYMRLPGSGNVQSLLSVAAPEGFSARAGSPSSPTGRSCSFSIGLCSAKRVQCWECGLLPRGWMGRFCRLPSCTGRPMAMP